MRDYSSYNYYLNNFRDLPKSNFRKELEEAVKKINWRMDDTPTPEQIELRKLIQEKAKEFREAINNCPFKRVGIRSIEKDGQSFIQIFDMIEGYICNEGESLVLVRE